MVFNDSLYKISCIRRLVNNFLHISTEELNQKFAGAIKSLQTQNSRMPGVSLGYAYYDAAVSHIQNVVEEADAMLYKNKHS